MMHTIRFNFYLSMVFACAFALVSTLAIAQDVIVNPPDVTVIDGPPVPGLTSPGIDPTRVGGWGSLAALFVVLLGQALKSPVLGGWLTARGPAVKRLVLACMALAAGAVTSWIGGLAWREALSTAAVAVVSSTWLWEQTAPVVDAVKARAARSSQPTTEPPPAL